MFEYASQFGDLIVGINTDDYIYKKHGIIKIPLKDRIYLLESIKYIKKVIPFSEETPCELIIKLQPDIFIKGPDYRNVEIPELKLCEELHIDFKICTGLKKYNSRELIGIG